MAQAVINEDDTFDLDAAERASPRHISPLRSSDRFESPNRTFSRYVVFKLNSVF